MAVLSLEVDAISVDKTRGLLSENLISKEDPMGTSVGSSSDASMARISVERIPFVTLGKSRGAKLREQFKVNSASSMPLHSAVGTFFNWPVQKANESKLVISLYFFD